MAPQRGGGKSERAQLRRQARALIRARARENPPLWAAIAADANAVAPSLGQDTARSRAGKVWLALRMIWEADAFLALCLIRIGTACRGRGLPILPMVCRRLAMVLGQVHIGAPVILGPGLILPHGQVVIDGLTRIGPNCLIRPYVTIGLIEGEYQGPSLEARVVVGTGAKILGPVQLGKGARIGANAVVLRDVPPAATALGVPARLRGAGVGGGPEVAAGEAEGAAGNG